MAISLFGLFDLKPYWEDHTIEDDYVGMKLIIGTVGYFIGFWTVLISFIASTSITLLDAFDIYLPTFMKLFQTLWFNLIIASVFAPPVIYLQLRFNESFQDFDLQEEFKTMMVGIQQIGETSDGEEGKEGEDGLFRIKFWTIIIIQILNGVVSGVLFSFVYLIPFFTISFIMIFILGNIIPASLFLIYSSFFVSWIFVYIFSSNRRLRVHDVKRDKIKREVYPLKRRDIDILTSAEPPIVCENCRSFIPATSESCPVCHEDIITGQES